MTDQIQSLAASLVGTLSQKGLTVTTGESCTGGLVSASLVSVPGASKVLRAAFVTYANGAKEAVAGVRKTTLARHGAVSPETAREMAEGVRRMADADMGISTTGIAGPGGGTPEKPVGLVYVGCSLGRETQVRRYTFTGSRQENRAATLEAALKLALEMLCPKEPEGKKDKFTD